MSLNLQLNNQKHNQNNYCKKYFKKQSLNLQLNKVFGDMLTFYTFIFKFGAVRYEDVCTAHTHKERERESARVCYTHSHGLSPYSTNSSRVCFLKVIILTDVNTGSRRLTCIEVIPAKCNNCSKLQKRSTSVSYSSSVKSCEGGN